MDTMLQSLRITIASVVVGSGLIGCSSASSEVLILDETTKSVFAKTSATDLPRLKAMEGALPKPTTNEIVRQDASGVERLTVFPGLPAADGTGIQGPPFRTRLLLQPGDGGLRVRVYYLGGDDATAKQLRKLADPSSGGRN